MKIHAKALSPAPRQSSTKGLRPTSGISPTRGASSRIKGSSALVTLFALVCALAFAASAGAAYKKTAEWDTTTPSVASAPTRISYGLDLDSVSGDLFTGASSETSPGAGEIPGITVPGEIEKWTALGAPGAPPVFGGSFSAKAFYAGVATHPSNHNLYALVDPGASAAVAIYMPDGSLVDDFPVTASKPVGIDVDADGHVYVPDPAAGVINEYDPAGALVQTFEPGVGKGTLNDPADVALDAAGNLYVADRSTNAVNERQEVDIHGATGGTYKLTFDGETTGVTFTGDTHTASGTADVHTATGTADSTLLATGTGFLTKGSTTVTGLTTDTGSFSVGESIFAPAQGANQPGLTRGTTIVAVNSGAGTLTLSHPARSSSNLDGPNTLRSGSKVLTSVSTSTGTFAVGMTVSGAGAQTCSGIAFTCNEKAHATTITAVNPGAGTITLSDGVTFAGVGGSLSGSEIVNVSTLPGSGDFEVGQMVSGALWGFGFFPVSITAVGPGTITIPDVAESSANGIALNAASPIIDDVDVIDGNLSVGGVAYGPGIAPGTTVAGFDRQARTITVQGSEFGVGVNADGDDVTLHADMGRLALAEGNDTGSEMLEALPNVGAAVRFDAVSNIGEIRRAESDNVLKERQVIEGAIFQKAMGGRNLPEMTCDGTNLTGGPTPGTCSVVTAVQGGSTPGRVVKFDSAGAFVEDFIPAQGTYTAEAVEVDRTNGDVYVAGGNSRWPPIGGEATPSGPDFSVKRYDVAGTELAEIGFGSLGAAAHEAQELVGQLPRVAGPAFGLSVDPSTQKVYTVMPTGDGSTNPSGRVRGTVRVFAPAHTVTVETDGTGDGTVDADSGAIQACATGGGGVCTDEYEAGSTVTFTADPDVVSVFSGWTVDGQPGACPGTGDCTITVDADTTIHATFDHQQSLTVTKNGAGAGAVTSDPAGIDCGSTCGPLPFTEGSDVELTATPQSGSTFAGWSVPGQPGACPGTGTCTVTMSADVSVQATFRTPQSLTVVKEGSGSGTVASNPTGIDCGPTCGPVPFPETSSVVLTATPGAHQTFVGWSVDGQPGACPGTGTCTVTMNAATTVRATFTQNLQNLTVTRDGTGTGSVTSNPAGINCGASCGPIPFNEGADVVLSASPALHSAFIGWSVTGQPGACPGTGSCTVPMNAATSVKATFNLIRHDLTVTPQGTGTGSIDADAGAIEDCAKGAGTCVDSYIEGTLVTLMATPGAHSTLAWEGCDNSNGNTCEVSVDAATEVKATFTLIEHALTVTMTGSGTGSISCNGLACAPTYPEGTKVTLAAAAASGSTFSGWSGSGCSGTAPCTVTIDAATTVSANFALIPKDCTTDPSLCPKVDTDDRLAECVKAANRAFKAAKKKAGKKKAGKKKAKLLRAAGKRKAKAIKRCKVRFG